MTTPSTNPKSTRPDWLMPVIIAIVTGVIGIVLLALNGFYWMGGVLAVVDAIGISTIIAASRARSRNNA
jgi:hypothetical protein